MSSDSLASLFTVGSDAGVSWNGLLSQWIGSDSAGSTQRCHCYLCQASALLAPGERNLDGEGDTPWPLIPIHNASSAQPLEKRATFKANQNFFRASISSGKTSQYMTNGKKYVSAVIPTAAARRRPLVSQAAADPAGSGLRGPPPFLAARP